MENGGLIAIRFALYADLMLLVGLAAFPLYSFKRDEREPRAVLHLAPLLAALAGAALAISMLGFAISTAAMMGVPIVALDRATLASMATDTDMGAAWCVRLTALVGALACLRIFRHQQTLRLGSTLAASAVALATLVWSGHAAATEGALGTAHRISDIAHMIAAALWIGGIAAFGLMLSARRVSQTEDHRRIVARTLADFARVGTGAVVIIVVTGLINGVMILGDGVFALFQTTYGLLLTAKIALFTVMLVFAANNRWRIAPALKHSLAGTGRNVSLTQLRTSVALEAIAGAAILAVVARLGTNAPDVN